MSIVTYASQPVSASGSPDTCLRRPWAAHRASKSTPHLSAETWLAAAAVELRGAGVSTRPSVRILRARAPMHTFCVVLRCWAGGEIKEVEWYHDEPQWGLLPMRGTCRILG